MYTLVYTGHTALCPICYYFVYWRVPLIQPEAQRPPRPLSYPQVLPMLSTGRARFHVEHKLSTGCTQATNVGMVIAQVVHRASVGMQ